MNSESVTSLALITIIAGGIIYLVLGLVLSKQMRYRNRIRGAILVVVITLANWTGNGGCLSPNAEKKSGEN